jgi:hypothetical protein
MCHHDTIHTMLRYIFQKTPVREFGREFRLISLRPYLTYDTDGSLRVDMKKPFVFPHRIELATPDVEASVLPKKSYECADDICMIALTLEQNMDALREATLEAARRSEAEFCRYIRIEDPQQTRGGAATVVLENKKEAAEHLQSVLVISLSRHMSELK